MQNWRATNNDAERSTGQTGKSVAEQISGSSLTSFAGEQHLRLPGTPDALPRIRSLVVSAAEAMSFSEEDIGKIEMAVGEACTNIIEHAYVTQPLREEIDVVVKQHADRLEITLLDYSTINFPIDDSSGVALDDYINTQRRRGLGLYIIRTFVDLVEHRFICGQGNELRLVKFRA